MTAPDRRSCRPSDVRDSDKPGPLADPRPCVVRATAAGRPSVVRATRRGGRNSVKRARSSRGFESRADPADHTQTVSGATCGFPPDGSSWWKFRVLKTNNRHRVESDVSRSTQVGSGSEPQSFSNDRPADWSQGARSWRVWATMPTGAGATVKTASRTMPASRHSRRRSSSHARTDATDP